MEYVRNQAFASLPGIPSVGSAIETILEWMGRNAGSENIPGELLEAEQDGGLREELELYLSIVEGNLAIRLDTEEANGYHSIFMFIFYTLRPLCDLDYVGISWTTIRGWENETKSVSYYGRNGVEYRGLAQVIGEIEEVLKSGGRNLDALDKVAAILAVPASAG